MKKLTFPQLLFSSIFFVIAIFNILLLLLSGSVSELSQMFRLMTEPHGVYFFVEITFLVCGFIFSIFSMFRVYNLPKLYMLFIFYMACLFLYLLYYEIFVVVRSDLDLFSLEDTLAFNRDTMFVKPYRQMFVDYIMYIFFVILPSIIYIFSLNFSKQTKIGRILHLTKPNLNVVISTLFAFSIAPFFSGDIFGYIDMVMLVFGVCLVIFIWVKKKLILDSYEYFNLFLLLIISCVMIVCSHKFVDIESYFEIRKSIYAFVLFGWCNMWMVKLKAKSLQKDIK
ncbi:hypothetical protein [Helicobacter sp. WB40]|uniref:hypothetical protein n=1 Tax=Helicobacter sp. WB40 TaxID=3004130 RepID=UPI0022EBE931|nr:hypothetical protein [Helicobacter sp. WB40]MDA3966801.1 hypothetical protein [Helicobacter sp. WB40]